MANLKVSEQAYPSTRYTEGSAPSTPASGEVIIYAKADGSLYQKDDAGTETLLANAASGAVGTDAIWDAAGDLVQGTGANTAAKLTLGTAGQVLTVNGGATAAAWATPSSGATYYEQPTVTNYAAQFQATSTSCAVTVVAPTAGDKLIAVVYATGRGANSITQTNVTWTQRYTGNGNSSYLEVWTGVASASAGTTATAAFTGSNTQYVEIFTVNSAASAFTAASAVTTATSASGATATVSGAATAGTHYIVAASATSAVSTSISGVSHMYRPLTAFGGIARSGILRANANALSYWSTSNTASAFFTAIVSVT